MNTSPTQNPFSPLRSYTFINESLRQNGEVFAVGGSVRDHLLNRPIKDLDLLIRGIPFAELVKILKKSGRVNLVGKSFGIVKYHPQEAPDTELDIALPRIERSTGSGHRDFDVDFDETLPVEKDLYRRDFTINAIAYNISDESFTDPSGGLIDLQNKVIRTVFDNSFTEDPLRLLRAIQFAARLGFTLEDKTKTDLAEHAKLIKTVAKERIVQEVKKLFEAPKPSLGFDLMRETGLLRHVFPDVQKTIGVTQPNKNNEDVYTHTMKVLDASRAAHELDNPGDLHIMFSALFHDMGKPKTKSEKDDGSVSFFNHQLISKGIARRWLKEHKATTIGVDPERVGHLVKNHMFETTHFKDNDKALRRFIQKVGKDHIYDLIDLRLADKKGGRFPKKVYGILQLREKITEELNRQPPFTPKDLALKGADIVALGFQPSPVIGDIQRFLMEKVLDEPELNTVEDLTQIVRDNTETFQLWETDPTKRPPKPASSN